MYSAHQNLSAILDAVMILRPHTVLDYGAGDGNIGFLVRRYLEYASPDMRPTLHAIEPYTPYHTRHPAGTYDEAVRYGPFRKGFYDLLLLIDVVEHFHKPAGQALIAHLLNFTKNILVSTPKQFFDNPPSDNPLERHRSLWTRRDLTRFGPTCFLPSPVSHIALIGRDASRVKHILMKRRLNRLFGKSIW